ncbi:lasso peptide biosynthesis PqqD family chaperone [Streptomyces sp. NPDC021093]|uniref:lasso peptide biosynthesis PqqD family chaperone n=1 Tax=Streptomyces sp. NPDC021093 TaxID=3365112 RepID=UPI0037B072E4
MSLILRPDVSVAETEDGAVLLDEVTGRYWQLNRTAAFILRALRDGATQEQTAGRLRERHPALPADRAADDVASFVDALAEARLVAPA